MCDSANNKNNSSFDCLLSLHLNKSARFSHRINLEYTKSYSTDDTATNVNKHVRNNVCKRTNIDSPVQQSPSSINVKGLPRAWKHIWLADHVSVRAARAQTAPPKGHSEIWTPHNDKWSQIKIKDYRYIQDDSMGQAQRSIRQFLRPEVPPSSRKRRSRKGRVLCACAVAEAAFLVQSKHKIQYSWYCWCQI